MNVRESRVYPGTQTLASHATYKFDTQVYVCMRMRMYAHTGHACAVPTLSQVGTSPATDRGYVLPRITVVPLETSRAPPSPLYSLPLYTTLQRQASHRYASTSAHTYTCRYIVAHVLCLCLCSQLRMLIRTHTNSSPWHL